MPVSIPNVLAWEIFKGEWTIDQYKGKAKMIMHDGTSIASVNETMFKDEAHFREIVDQHNVNILLGITDSQHNEALGEDICYNF